MWEKWPVFLKRRCRYMLRTALDRVLKENVFGHDGCVWQFLNAFKHLNIWCNYCLQTVSFFFSIICRQIYLHGGPKKQYYCMCWRSTSAQQPRVCSGVVRIDPLRFLAGCRTRRLNQALSVLSLSLGFFWYMGCAVK